MIFSQRFNLLCLSSLLFFCSFNMIIPELYDFVLNFDGLAAKPWIIFAFTLVAFLSRPISGKLVDSLGRVPIMIFGSFVACVAALFYPLVTSVLWFIALRAFHGMSTGFKPTGSSAMIADIIPHNKRGRAMGYLGFMGSTGMALGPWLGSTLFNSYGYNALFFTSSFLAFLSILVIINIKETLPKPQRTKLRLSDFHITQEDLYEPKVWLPSLLFFLYCLAYGIVYNLSTDFGKKVFHIQNIGWYFLAMVASSMISRLIAGRVSDHKGRAPVVLVGLVILAIALSIFMLCTSAEQFYLGGIVFGLAVGVLSPTVYAWVADLSPPNKKGRAFSTMYMSMELGIGLGALLSSMIFNEELSQIPYAFAIALFFPVTALTILLWKWKK